MEVKPFHPSDLDELTLQPHQQAWKAEGLSAALTLGRAWTAVHNGAVVACAGALDRGEGRALAWALIAAGIGPRAFLGLHSAVKQGLVEHPYRRLEAHVDPSFAEGRRWMRLLGFQFEGTMRGYQADGRSLLLFARVV